MKKNRSYIFKEKWWVFLSTCSEDVNLSNVFRAINEYIFNGVLVDLSPMDKLAFTYLKKDIDAQLKQRDELSKKRSLAGTSGNKKRWSMDEENYRNCDNIGDNIANATNLSQMRQNNRNCDNKDDNLSNMVSQMRPKHRNCDNPEPLPAPPLIPQSPPYPLNTPYYPPNTQPPTANNPSMGKNFNNNNGENQNFDDDKECFERVKEWIVSAGMQEQLDRVFFKKEYGLSSEEKKKLKRKTFDELIEEFYYYKFEIREYARRYERTASIKYFQNWILNTQTKLYHDDDRRDKGIPNNPICSVQDIDYFGDS